MILGLVGMLSKVRLFSFAALAFIASAYIQRGPDTDTKQIFMAGMFSVAGMLMAHLQPPGAPATNATASATAAAT
ncbi:hypothetical protein HYH03_016971 [Edaphochlamys debaryana]|uniref:Uncharacterized protein n=1 Tax=Edaphochlamys debaryana TaxID=47281 RepID=A0A835XL36_9CHLO|nr:hypothetical protein HYH03_016971 [Edaphochlamys debaryana]|eukprot:KAG2484236.1 hypothetical protein HYH03_016971 [Edaphochlamys debaryana]